MQESTKTALKQFATEDTQLAIDSAKVNSGNGSMMITDTKIGLINIEYNSSWFTAFNNGKAVTGVCTQEEMIDWLIDQYQYQEVDSTFDGDY